MNAIYFCEFLTRLKYHGIHMSKVIFKGSHLIQTYRILHVLNDKLVCSVESSNRRFPAKFAWEPLRDRISVRGGQNFAKLVVEGVSEGAPDEGFQRGMLTVGGRNFSCLDTLVVTLRRP